MNIPSAKDIDSAPFLVRFIASTLSANALIAPDFWKYATKIPINTSIARTQIKSALPNAV